MEAGLEPEDSSPVQTWIFGYFWSLPMGVARGPFGIPLPSMSGLRPCVESGLEPEDSSPVLTWILGYFWSLSWGVSAHLVWGHARELS